MSLSLVLTSLSRVLDNRAVLNTLATELFSHNSLQLFTGH